MQSAGAWGNPPSPGIKVVSMTGTRTKVYGVCQGHALRGHHTISARNASPNPDNRGETSHGPKLRHIQQSPNCEGHEGEESGRKSPPAGD